MRPASVKAGQCGITQRAPHLKDARLDAVETVVTREGRTRPLVERFDVDQRSRREGARDLDRRNADLLVAFVDFPGRSRGQGLATRRRVADGDVNAPDCEDVRVVDLGVLRRE